MSFCTCFIVQVKHGTIIGMARITSRTLKEWGLFGALIVSMHYAYYKIQANPSLVAPHQRQELFYIRWLKEKIPALEGFGVQEEPKPALSHPPKMI